MRVYIPLDRSGLKHLAASCEVAPGRAYAVTPAFVEAYGSNDVEELEYAAMLAAADASAELGGGDDRRIVVAADTGAIEPADEHPGAVIVVAAVALTDVASIHVVKGDEGLAWYAPQELDDLIAEG